MSLFEGHVPEDVGAAYTKIDGLADWSEWRPFFDLAASAPLSPGVYQMRTGDSRVVYVGMAGDRKGQGLRGRLSIYRRGKGAVSGFGEAALDRALGDAAFIEEHLTAVRAGRAVRASVWARDAIAWARVEVRWAECPTADEALRLEAAIVEDLKPHGIWNRAAVGNLTAAVTADDDVSTVDALTRDFGLDDGGKTVRRILRKGFQEHRAGSGWDPLSDEQVAHVRASLVPRR